MTAPLYTNLPFSKPFVTIFQLSTTSNCPNHKKNSKDWPCPELIYLIALWIEPCLVISPGTSTTLSEWLWVFKMVLIKSNCSTDITTITFSIHIILHVGTRSNQRDKQLQNRVINMPMLNACVCQNTCTYGKQNNLHQAYTNVRRKP